jgi:hypothetical protein
MPRPDLIAQRKASTDFADLKQNQKRNHEIHERARKRMEEKREIRATEEH